MDPRGYRNCTRSEDVEVLGVTWKRSKDVTVKFEGGRKEVYDRPFVYVKRGVKR